MELTLITVEITTFNAVNAGWEVGDGRMTWTCDVQAPATYRVLVELNVTTAGHTVIAGATDLIVGLMERSLGIRAEGWPFRMSKPACPRPLVSISTGADLVDSDVWGDRIAAVAQLRDHMPDASHSVVTVIVEYLMLSHVDTVFQLNLEARLEV
jgi:hypothetical protein